MRCVLFLFVFLFVSQVAFADVVILKNGTRIVGDVLNRSDDGVTIKVEYGEMFVPASDLASYEGKSQKKASHKKIKQVSINAFSGESFEESYKGQKYVIYFPSTYNEKGNRFPLIVGLDPTGNGLNYSKSWITMAERYGYILVCPMNEGRHWMVEEAGKVTSLVTYLLRKYHIHSRKMFLTGYSGGGVFGYCIAINNPQYWRGFAPVCSSMFNVDKFLKYKHGKSVPVCIIAGSNDDVVGRDTCKRSAAKLRKYGYAVQYKEIQGMGYEARAENNETIIRFFNRYL